MRKIQLIVTGTPVGRSRTWAYKHGWDLGQFWIPTYQLIVKGRNDAGQPVRAVFEVLRFGVQCDDGRTAYVTGIAGDERHTIKMWLPEYKVHSFRSSEDGGWQVKGNYLVHDGPDNAGELYASIGCVEVMGPKGFVRLNDLIISLSGAHGKTRAAKLNHIGNAHNMTIHYLPAAVPPLVHA